MSSYNSSATVARHAICSNYRVAQNAPLSRRSRQLGFNYSALNFTSDRTLTYTLRRKDELTGLARDLTVTATSRWDASRPPNEEVVRGEWQALLQRAASERRKVREPGDGWNNEYLH